MRGAALSADPKQASTELAHQQIFTTTTTSAQPGQAIAISLNDGLKEPLERISVAVLLTDVLSRLTRKWKSMFGTQMRGMNERLVQTASTPRTY